MGGPWEDYQGGGTATASGPWEDYAPTKRPTLTPPGVPKPQVNVQPMSLVGMVNAATGHPDYQAQPIHPLDLVEGAAQDIRNLSVLTPVQMAAQRAGFTGKLQGIPMLRHLTEPPPTPEAVTRSGVNVGQAMLLSGMEAGERPTAVRPAVAPRVEAPPAPTSVLTPEQEAVNRAYAEQHPVGGSPYQRPALTPEQQAKFTRDIDKANKPFVKYQQAEDLAASKQQQAAVVQQDVQATHQRVYGDLQQRADAFRDASANVTRPTGAIEQSIEQARKDLSGTPPDLRIFNQVMQHLQDTTLEPQTAAFAERLGGGATPEQAAHGLPPQAEVPLLDLQRQYTALSNQWADAEGNVKRVLGDVRATYAKELQAGADSIGQGDAWRGLQKDWSQYYKDWRGTGPLAKVLKAPHPDYVVQRLTGLPGNLIRETYARYGDPSSIERLQQTANPPPSPPAPVTPPTPEAPGAPKTLRGRIMHRVIRAGSGLAAAASPVPGPPFVKYHIGAEAGAELANQLLRPRVPTPPTPEAYMREVVGAAPETQEALAAKYGLKSVGEANRRITKMGKPVRVTPLPPPQ